MTTHHLFRKSLTAVVIALFAALGQHADAMAKYPKTHALWIFPDPALPGPGNPITDPAARQKLLDDAAASQITMLYVSVFQNGDHPNSAGRLMYDDNLIAAFVGMAHAQAMQVYAAYGAPDWATYACDPTTYPVKRMSDVAGYNAAYPGSKFDGVVLDVEPPETEANPQDEAQFQALLRHYQCMRDSLPSDVALSAAVRFFWKLPVDYPAGAGPDHIKPIYQHIIDMEMHNVVVMGYRDHAGTSDPLSDGLIASDQDQINYADSQAKPIPNSFGQYPQGKVLVGLETSDPATTGISNKETFFEEGQKILNAAARVVAAFFESGLSRGFGGFAVHNYGNSYLSGSSAAWPTTNPDFPINRVDDAQEVSVPAGSMVMVPVTVNGSTVTLTFANVSSAGTLYVSTISAAEFGSLPGGYELTSTPYAFEIATTAKFAGAVTIDFRVNLDQSVFGQLRVLHNADGVISDATLLSPSPSAPQTISATTMSLSPFIIVRSLDTTPPTINSVTATPSSIWPPNKKMVPVALSVDAFDASGVASEKIVAVASNEAGSGQWQMTGNLTLNLQADRNGTGPGRVYTITVECKDRFGNAARRNTIVTVPHDKGK